MFDIAVLIIAIMLAVGGIIYGLGYALDNRRIKEFGMSELIQSTINGAILFVLFAAFSRVGVVTQIINQLSGNLSSSAASFCGPYLSYNYGLCTSYNYLVGSTFIFNNNLVISLSSQISGILALLIDIYLVIGTISTVGFSFVFISFKLTALSIFLMPLKFIIEFLSTSLMMVFIQAAIVYGIAFIVPILLYVGLTLRTFYFTRRLGGSILAIAIGFYTVFPMTYIMNITIIQSAYPSVLPSLYSAIENFGQAVSNYSSSLFSTINFSQIDVAVLSYNFVKSLINSNSITNTISSSITSSILNLYTNSLSSMSPISNAFNSLVGVATEYLSYLVMDLFILPFMSFVLTIISVRELARILGSEISFGKFDIF
ncbi:MAG: hypothetical protein ACP5RI_01735 [Candidatus Micrarchaeia archaeon]